MITAAEAKAELLRRRARVDLIAFLAYCWWMPTPLKIGRHTRILCNRLTRAIDDYIFRGKTTYLLVNMPFRHGKSDIVSRALPAFFFGRTISCGLEPNAIQSGYGASLVEGFSSKVQDIIRSEAYQRVFPEVQIAKKASAAEWSVVGKQSTDYAMGLGGSITGKGANLIIVDDYCKNREEAESKATRDKMWDSFKDDLSTRFNAGGGIMVVCATRWHEDDISGRIEKAMRTIENYPQYEKLIFPARKQGEDGWDILFPELYDEGWYRTRRAELGPYSAGALLDCDPKQAGERFFRDEWRHIYVGEIPKEKVAGMRINIFIDGAKSKRAKSDWTTMLVIGRGRDGNYYLLDGVHEKLNLQEKIEKLTGIVRKWGGPSRVKITWWEQVGPMSDVEALRMSMTHEMYHFTVRELHHNTNKDFRIKKLAVPFSQGRIWTPSQIVRTRLERGGAGEPDKPVVYDFIADFNAEYEAYTGFCEDLEHDDIIDCLADIMDDEVLKSFKPPEEREEGRGGSAYQDEDAGWASGKRFR